MMDGIIKADGTSRLMRAELPATYEAFRAQCLAGAQPLDVLFNAIGWSQMPTFLNKANLLKDSTTDLFALPASAVPDDVLAFLGKYNEHWWKGESSGYAIELGNLVSTQLFTVYDNDSVITYAENVYADSNGNIVLNNTNTVGLSWYSVVADCDVLKGKYFKSTDGILYFCPTNSTFTTVTSGEARVFSASVQAVTAVANENASSVFFVQSSNRNAYPDKGEQDGVIYEYLGIPFDNAVNAPKIAFGSYIGTGTYGSGNKTTLTFDFIPKIVFIIAKTGALFHSYQSTLQEWIMLINGMTSCLTKQSSSNSGTGTTTVSWSDKTVSWYGTWAGAQLNTSGKEYIYVAIG